MFQCVVQSSRESNNKKYHLRYPVLHPTISLEHVKMELISDITKKKKVVHIVSITDIECNLLHLIVRVRVYFTSNNKNLCGQQPRQVAGRRANQRSENQICSHQERRRAQARWFSKRWFACHSATLQGCLPPKMLLHSVVVEATDYVFPETIHMMICTLTRRGCGR